MICPYPDCGGEVKTTNIVGHCQKCSQPIFLCRKCQGTNRAFARYCRRCKEPIVFPTIGPTEVWQPGTASHFARESRRIIVNDQFWVSPSAYRGFLWGLSLRGVVWKLSPFNPQPIPYSAIGDGFGKSAFLIRELLANANGEDWILYPYLLSISPQAVKGVNLLTKEARELAQVSSEEHILSSFEEGFVTLEADSQMIYFLKKRSVQVSLVACNLLDVGTKEFTLDEPEVVGPFKIGHRVCVYSKNIIYALEGDKIRPHALPKNFTAWVSPNDVKDIQRIGQMPFLVYRDSVYIPGRVGGDPGLLSVAFQGSSVASAPISIRGEATYTQDPTGRLILAKSGEIVVYDGSAAVVRKEDRELSGRGVPYYDEPIAIGRAKSAGGFESLRFFLDGTLADYPLANLDGFVEAMGFYCVAGAMVFAYLSHQNHIRMVVWDF
jgi:hypothetical protein